MSEIVNLPQLGSGFQDPNIDKHDEAALSYEKSQDIEGEKQALPEYSDEKVGPIDSDVLSVKDAQAVVLQNVCTFVSAYF